MVLSCRNHPLESTLGGATGTGTCHGRVSHRTVVPGIVRPCPCDWQDVLGSYVGNAKHTGSFEGPSIELGDGCV